MSSTPGPQIRVIALGRSAATAVLWRFRGALRATVVVKATFDIVPSGVMTLAAPDDLVKAEINHGNSQLRSVRLTSDLAPFVPAGDVVLTGHAMAPGGTPVTSLQTRLVVFDGDTLLVDKRILIRGDLKDDKPAPFTSIPLIYERAYGGIGFTDNPLGVGADTTQHKAPNLLSPDGPEIVACYAPVSRVMPGRRRLLKSLDRATLDKPVAEVPDDFDWSYFHVAPPGQRIPYLKGHERIVLEGMHASHPRLVSSLPGARAAARVFGLPGAGIMPVPLVADLLRIDTDALSCTVVWRGSFTLPPEAPLDAIAVLAAAETATDAVSWPESPPAADVAPAPKIADTSPSVPTSTRDFSRTTAIDDGPQGPALPFRPGAARLPPGAPPARRPAPSRHTSTVDLPPPEAAPHTLPFQRPPASAALASAALEAIELDSAEIEDVTIELEREPEVLRSSSAHAAVAVVSPPPLPAAPFAEPSVPSPPPAVPFSPPGPAAPPGPLGGAPDSEAPSTTPLLGLTTPAAAAPKKAGPKVSHDPKLAVALHPWSLSPSRDCVSVIAKLSCDIVPDSPAEPRAAADSLRAETAIPTERGPVCDYPSDFVPFKPRADVVLRGHAHAPSGRAASSEVVFVFGHPGALITRRILVLGDRVWQQGKVGLVASAPEPFSRMPLTWGRAFGGRGFELNPAGKGFREPLRLARDASLPNLEDPDRRIRLPSQRPEPACPGPVPESWRARWARLGRDAPVFGALGDTFDWTLLQAATRSQQLPHLRGDEPFEITGVHPQHAKIAGSLPGLRASASFARKVGHLPPGELPLALDTVVLDADTMSVHLVFRGVIPVTDEKQHGIDDVTVTLEKV